MYRNGEPALGWRLGLTFAVAVTLYLVPTPNSMAQNILVLATSLVDHGSVELHDYVCMDVAVRHGRILSGMPPGASFISAPVYLLARSVLTTISAANRTIVFHVLCTLLVAIPAAAMVVALVYNLAVSWGASRRNAVLTAGMLAFGTMHFNYATGFDKNILAAACVTGACALLAKAREGGARNLRAVLAGALCGLAISSNYPIAIIVVILGAYFLFLRPGCTPLFSFLAGFSLAILPTLFYHEAAFGSPWLTGYSFRSGHLQGFRMGAPQFMPFLSLLYMLLCSSPCLIWSVTGWWRGMRVRERRPEMLMIAGAVLGMTVIVSGSPGYAAAGGSFASRLLLPMLPFAILPMAFGLPRKMRGLPLLVVGWSVGATLLATQAILIPSWSDPARYALQVLATSFGTGPLFSETLAGWLAFPTLHLIVWQGGFTLDLLLQPANRDLFLAVICSQAIIKLFSMAVTAAAAWLLWRFVWRPFLPAPVSDRKYPAGSRTR